MVFTKKKMFFFSSFILYVYQKIARSTHLENKYFSLNFIGINIFRPIKRHFRYIQKNCLTVECEKNKTVTRCLIDENVYIIYTHLSICVCMAFCFSVVWFVLLANYHFTSLALSSHQIKDY